jgi:hypothetical protein
VKQPQPIQDVLPGPGTIAGMTPRRVARRRGAAWQYSLGLAPILALSAAIGLAVIAAANNGARLEHAGSEAAFWLGLLLIYLPIALRLFGRSAQPPERMALVLVLGMALYLVKVVHSPAGFTLHDELASWRGVQDLLESGRLFADNPLVGGYSVFPGMTAVTGALTQLSGLSVFVSALILIGTARAVLMASLFLILERATSRLPWRSPVGCCSWSCAAPASTDARAGPVTPACWAPWRSSAPGW